MPQWIHHDASIVMIVGAKDCARCHPREAQETQVSGHAGLQEGLDVSRGACLVCHYNHSFELASAREPQICERCHAAADHPIMDAYAVSKHGVLFRTQYDRMNLRAQPWVVGRDYWAAPTCATCHMSATPTQSVTHSTGSRLAFSPGAAGWLRTDGWQARRARMADVCGQCHSQSWLKGYFADFDRRRQSAARVPQAMPLR